MLENSQLDAELAIALEQYVDLNIWQDIPAARQYFAEMVVSLGSDLPVIEGVSTEDLQVAGLNDAPDVSVRLYRPSDSAGCLPVLLWIHGGGFVLGSIDSDDYRIKELVQKVGCAVVSVEYRLAPEHPYPAAVEDCYAALKWLAEFNEEYKFDTSRIAIGGISAGGGLAASLALFARDRAEISVIFQMLLCPMLDDTNTTASSHAITDTRVWNRECNLNGWAAYLGETANQATSPYAAAARATDLSNLPPAYIPVGSLDLFLGENVEYAKRLQQSGVSVELRVIKGGFHAFEHLVPDAEVSLCTRTMHHEALRNAFQV
jgi:acetyl esterase/lipase